MTIIERAEKLLNSERPFRQRTALRQLVLDVRAGRDSRRTFEAIRALVQAAEAQP